jgi:hypothetical protein
VASTSPTSPTPIAARPSAHRASKSNPGSLLKAPAAVHAIGLLLKSSSPIRFSERLGPILSGNGLRDIRTPADIG